MSYPTTSNSGTGNSPNLNDTTQTLLILDDIACGDDVKRRTSELVKLAFSGRHDNMSVWLLSQQLTSVSKPFRENIGALVVFYTPSKSDLEAILSDYGGEITKEQLQEYMRHLKTHPHSKMIFSLRYPYDHSLRS